MWGGTVARVVMEAGMEGRRGREDRREIGSETLGWRGMFYIDKNSWRSGGREAGWLFKRAPTGTLGKELMMMMFGDVSFSFFVVGHYYWKVFLVFYRSATHQLTQTANHGFLTELQVSVSKRNRELHILIAFIIKPGGFKGARKLFVLALPILVRSVVC